MRLEHTATGGTTARQDMHLIAWAQTEVDGFVAAPRAALTIGASWCWWGEMLTLEAPLPLPGETAQSHHLRCAQEAYRLVGVALQGTADQPRAEDRLRQPMHQFRVCNGAQSHDITLIELGQGQFPLLLICGARPEPNRDLWIEALSPGAADPNLPEGSMPGTVEALPGLATLPPGSMVDTSQGALPVESLRAGDLISTRNGPVPVQWAGRSRLSGARLFAMPELRPVRLGSDVLGDQPATEVTLPPDHLILISGARAEALFGLPEVLVEAGDLAAALYDEPQETQAAGRELHYVHLLLAQPQVFRVNGLDSATQPADSDALSRVDPNEREALFAAFPQVAAATARPALSRGTRTLTAHDARGLRGQVA